VREGAKKIIAETADIEAVGEASSGHEALGQIVDNDCDVVLLDIALPGMDGLEVLRAVRGRKPGLPVVILSMYPEEQQAARVLKEGAFGYVTKGRVPRTCFRPFGVQPTGNGMSASSSPRVSLPGSFMTARSPMIFSRPGNMLY
jgi:DNA-binding NarL/FixJ family response regulator